MLDGPNEIRSNSGNLSNSRASTVLGGKNTFQSTLQKNKIRRRKTRKGLEEGKEIEVASVLG